ncbi:MAG TPA: protein-disulfide reductase DsbD domain-containing protein [Luteibaculaceae bacterium]|nr:protein-disulfide reductase DsbD domain-containing protein [Luteibaculaceae bacterium]
MKKLLTALFLLTTTLVFAQIVDPVKWSYSVEDKGNGNYELLFTASIDKGWHVYTTNLPEGGPIPTSFSIKPGKSFKTVGGIIEKGFKTEYDNQFDMKLSYFEKKAVWRQRITSTATQPFQVSGELEFMVCDNNQCLPPSIEDFSFTVVPSGTAASTSENQPVENSSITAAAPSTLNNPVKWTFSSERVNDSTYLLVANAKVEKGWHLYALDLGKEAEKAGPEPTRLSILPSENYTLLGGAAEPTPITRFDPNFRINIKFHENEARFTQKLVVKSEKPGTVKGNIYFMVCDDMKCLPPETIDFTIDLSTGQPVAEQAATSEAAVEKLKNLKINTIDLNAPLSECGEVVVRESKSFWNIFILGFLGGLIALLTPCVFPMIPLTVSFFTKSSGNRRKGIINASIYGGFIFLIYIILSLPFHFLDSLDPEILNTISTNVWLNLAFFIIFIVFAISFFGYFEITLPAGLLNKADSASEVGGLIGTFFMALTLALVSFSCTGPILGSLLAGSLTSDGGAMQLTAGMGGFGLALALPFTLFALFPGMLKALPKSGGWLNTVKVLLGFIEIALAIKFLSTADLVGHWEFLKIELFLGIWILVAVGMALYLFGFIRFPHDSPNAPINITRKVLGVVSVALALYFASGFRYSEKNQGFESLTLLSGLAPSSGYSWIYPSQCPLNLNCFHSYEEGMAYAKKVGKPVMLDFTGHGCVNCRKMEENVWPKAGVYKLLSEEYVVISLYTDDREKLPADEQFEYVNAIGKKKKIRTVGDKWATFQTETFAINAQPYYVLLNNEGQLLNNPVAYTPDADKYQAFLKCGLETFKTNSGK